MKLIRFQNNSFILVNLKNSLEQNHVHCAYLNNSIHKMQSKKNNRKNDRTKSKETQNKISKV